MTGYGADRILMTEQPGREPVTDFFESGAEYDDATSYSAPEIIRTFRCVAVAEHPHTGEPFAFGFMHTNAAGWGGTGMGPEHWRKGWNRHERPADAAQPEEPRP